MSYLRGQDVNQSKHDRDPVGAGPERTSREDASATRYERGWDRMKLIDGTLGERVISWLEPLAPDLARYTVEFPFGDMFDPSKLDLRSREIATVAALTAMGNAAPQLKVHMHAALNVGLTRAELVEVVSQMAVYAGFPAALNGMTVAEEVFAERDGAESGTAADPERSWPPPPKDNRSD